MLKKILDNKIFKIVYKTFKIVFFFLIIVYLLFTLFQRFSNNSSIMGFRVFNVASGSMEPIYEIGDVVLVKEVDTKTLKVGDDVTYLGQKGDMKDKIVTHRIIKINSDNTFITKGVHNEYEDPSINESQIYGKVSYKIKVISFINTTLRSKVGFYFLVFVPLVLVVFLEVADTILEIREGKKNEEEKA